MQLFLDHNRFKYQKFISGEVLASGKSCTLIIVFLARVKIVVMRGRELDKEKKFFLFQQSEVMNEGIEDFSSVVFPFLFNLPLDSPSSFEFSHWVNDDCFQVSLRYKIKAELKKDQKVLETCSKTFTYVGKPYGKSNHCKVILQARLLNFLPFFISAQVDLPSNFIFNGEPQSFSFKCLKISKFCKVLEVVGKLVHRVQIKITEDESFSFETVLFEKSSNSHDFSQVWTIRSEENVSSLRSEHINSEYFFVVSVFYRICCQVKKIDFEYVFFVSPKKQEKHIIHQLPNNLETRQIKTISLSRAFRNFTSSSYRRTTATESDSLTYQQRKTITYLNND
jgi:hypothetical protein